MNISRNTAMQIFFDELGELCRIYGKFYGIKDEQSLEYVRSQIYKVTEIAVKFGFAVMLYWDDTKPLYFRPLHGFTIH